MQDTPGRPSAARRWVTLLTALVVALSGTLVVLSASPAAARTGAVTAATKPVAKKPAAKKPAGRDLVKVTVRQSARATARQAVRARVTVQVSQTVTAVSRPPRKGMPVGRAKVTRKARATASARAVRTTTRRATATGISSGTSRAKATARARSKARANARALALTKARPVARTAARKAARQRARTKAVRQARAKATAAARTRARWLARLDRIDRSDPTTWVPSRRGTYTPPGGPRFNNPYARSKAKRRILLTHVIRTINSSPGYLLTKDPKTHRRLTCPSDPRLAPSSIRVAVYSIGDRRFADALVAAHRRCVSVQVLMNSHLTATTSPAWARIVKALGHRHERTWRRQRSFAHRCSNGCLGTSVLHSKFFLFSRAGRARDTVVTGSSNMTRNAVAVQWNDLFTVNKNKRLYGGFRAMFARMVPDRRATGPYVYRAGRYTATFYPFRNATRRTDRTIRALDTISCRGARKGTGIRGRTVVYIAMHAWFTGRGAYLARKVRQLYARGCYVRILYSFMAKKTYRILSAGTGPRMRVRRVLFPGRLGLRAVKYSHLKMVAASGHIRSNRAARVVWTGSNNWTDKSLHADETTLEIRSAQAYRRYAAHWRFMERRRSTPVWALFQEPRGGGRAP